MEAKAEALLGAAAFLQIPDGCILEQGGESEQVATMTAFQIHFKMELTGFPGGLDMKSESKKPKIL